MKRFLIIVLCLALCLSFVACGNKKETEQMANATWDCVEYDSLDELNAAIGMKLCTPGVMGVTDEFYGLISETIADYKFTVNGIECSFRATPAFDTDPSGVWVGETTAFDGKTPSDTVEYVSTEDCKLARWATIDGQYVFNMQDPKMEDSTFESIVEELKAMTQPGMSDAEEAAFYEALAGEYMDSTSQRAKATVKSLEGAVLITVNWANSAESESVWTMTAQRGEDGLLNYSDEESKVVNYAADGSSEETVLYTDGEGFFAVSEDNSLAWTGATEENCKTCIFEKIPQ